jgi:hypothetical protein
MPAFSRLMDTRSEHNPVSTLSAEFLLAGGVVRRVACGDTRRAHMVAAHLRLINSTLHHHHSGEDQHVGPLLDTRAPSPESVHVLRVMAQHRRVDADQAEVDVELPVWSCSATADSRDRLAPRAGPTRRLGYREHAAGDARGRPRNGSATPPRSTEIRR